MFVVKKYSSKRFHFTNELNELRELLSIRVNLVPKPCYEDYESLLFNEVLDRVKLSLSDQYQHKYNIFDNI